MRVLAPSAVLLLSVCLPLVAAPKISATGVDAYAALGVKTKKVLTATTINSNVLPGEDAKQVVSIVTYMTGRKTREDAVNVRFGVFRDLGEGKLAAVYTQDLGEFSGGIVGDGDLQLIDLDLDGTSELIVFYDDFSDPLIEQRKAVVYMYEDGAFVPRWSGPVEYDATKKVRDFPEERRDRFVREIDLANTMRTRGITLFFEKRMIAVAGEKLSQPKVVSETFPLRAKPRR